MKLLQSSLCGAKRLHRASRTLQWRYLPEILSSATMRASRSKDSGGEEDKGQSVTRTVSTYEIEDWL